MAAPEIKPMTDAEMAVAPDAIHPMTDEQMAGDTTVPHSPAIPQKWPHSEPVPHSEPIVVGKPALSAAEKQPIQVKPGALMQHATVLFTGAVPYRDAAPGSPEDYANSVMRAFQNSDLNSANEITKAFNSHYPEFAQTSPVPHAAGETPAETKLNEYSTAAKDLANLPGKALNQAIYATRNTPVLSNMGQAVQTAEHYAGEGLQALSKVPTWVPGEKKLVDNLADAADKFAAAHPRISNAANAVGNFAQLGAAIIPAGAATKSMFAALDKVAEVSANVTAKAIKATPGVVKAIPGALRDAPETASNVAGNALTGAGQTAENMAARIQGTKVKINSPEMSKGATNAMYSKYGVFGNASQVQSQWQSKIVDVAKQLREKIQSVEFDAADPSSRINIAQAVNAAKQKVAGTTRLNRLAMDKVAQDVSSELEFTYGLDFAHAPAIKNNVDLAEAQLLKQEIGGHGDWLEHNGKMMANENATNKASFYNALYDELKTQLENKGKPGIKELNKQLSEMIPMERAARKQILVESRKNPIGLDDFLGFGMAVGHAAATHGLSLALPVANVISKSPSTARALYGAGQSLKSKGRKLMSTIDKE